MRCEDMDRRYEPYTVVGRERIEAKCYLGVLVVLAIMYLYYGYFRPPGWFGFNQLQHTSPVISFCMVALAGLGWVARSRLFGLWTKLNARMSRLTGSQKTQVLLLALLVCGLLFWGLRNEFINNDGIQLEPKFARDVPVRGAHLTHDEILELFVHSRFWFYTNQLFGWSVAQSYQVLSSIGGVFFVALLFKYGFALGRERGGMIVAGVAACGFMQLFFGDVENYTLVSVLILAYLYTGHLYLKRRCSLIVPSAILGTAMMFHLLAGWLLPSLVYLYWMSARKREFRAMALGAVSGLVICCCTIAYFHYNGLPLKELYYNSHAFGHGGDIGGQLADVSLDSYFQKINLLFLLVPPVIFIIPMILFGRIGWRPETAFLSIATFFMVVFMFIWKAMLGVYDDWNLFAPAMIPLSILLWHTMSRANSLPWKNSIAYFTIMLSALHSYSWIVSNHFR